MRFVTNQWIAGLMRQRESQLDPVEVSVTTEVAWDDWSKENGVVLEISATRGNGDYQSIYFTKRELGPLLRVLASVTDHATVKKTATAALSRIDDEKFIKIFETALTRRLARKGKRSGGFG